MLLADVSGLALRLKVTAKSTVQLGLVLYVSRLRAPGDMLRREQATLFRISARGPQE